MSLTDLLAEVRRAARRLRATPTVTFAAIACLSIGIWMASVVTAVGRGFFRPDLHIPHPERVVQLDERGLYRTNETNDCRCAQASRAVVDSLAHSHLFAAVGYYSSFWSVRMEGDQKSHPATNLSSGMMGVLQMRPAAGRLFIPDDDRLGDALVLSYQYWHSAFGGDPRVIGRHVDNVTSNYPLAIAGIMALVGFVSVVACGIPGYRAGRLNPVDCLRSE